MRVVIACGLLASGCFTKPERPGAIGDVGMDAHICPTVGDDFENANAPTCGTWGSFQPSAGMLMRTGGGLQATVAGGQAVGCLGFALDIAAGVWLEIDTTQSGSDLTQFALTGGTRIIELHLDDNTTPTWQGRSNSSGVTITPSTTQIYSRDVMKFWRFTRGTADSLYKHIDVAYSTTGDPSSYIKVLSFGISGPEMTTVTPSFTVTGATSSLSHASTRFDNYNAPCVP